MKFYAASTALHTTGFSALCFFFRYRRITAVPTLIIGTAYYGFFKATNNMLYKLTVDKAVLASARGMGLGAHAQPVGTLTNRNITYA
jgi:hypothetical protein